MLNLPKNIWVMSAVMALSFASTSMMVLIAGLIGAKLAPTPQFATLPYAVVVIGTACASIPAALLMQKLGRKRGVTLSLMMAIGAALLAAYAVSHGLFWLFVGAAFLLGANASFAQQGRFIILENAVGEKQQADGLTLALLANLTAAFIGPWMGQYGQFLFANAPDFMGSFILLVGVLAVALLLLSQYSEQAKPISVGTSTGRPLWSIIRQPSFLIAAGSAGFGFGIMALVMTATPVSMHEMQGHSLGHATWVIQAHIIAMFLPSLLTGRLLKMGFSTSLLFVGLLLYLIMCIVAYSGQQVMHYWWALVVLGVGWNLLFMTSTAKLGLSHTGEEKFKAQACNDFLVFGVQAIAAFSAGWLLFTFGWQGVINVAVAMTLFWLISLVLLNGQRRRTDARLGSLDA